VIINLKRFASKLSSQLNLFILEVTKQLVTSFFARLLLRHDIVQRLTQLPLAMNHRRTISCRKPTR
jgi:hypothetical protein